MNKVPTAEEYILNNMQGTDFQEIESALIKFAQMHVKAAIKATYNQALEDWSDEKILAAYPLENIK